MSRVQRTCARLDRTFRRFAFLHLLLLLAGHSAFAQTHVGNSMRIIQPAGFSCLDIVTNPNCECVGDAVVAAPPLPIITTAKSADQIEGTSVASGKTIICTLIATIADSFKTAPHRLTNTLGANLPLRSVASPGPFKRAPSGSTLGCTLPADTPAGTCTTGYPPTLGANATIEKGRAVSV